MMIFLLKNIKFFFFSNLLVIKHNLKYIIPSNLGKILYPLKTWHFYSIANEDKKKVSRVSIYLFISYLKFINIV